METTHEHAPGAHDDDGQHGDATGTTLVEEHDPAVADLAAHEGEDDLAEPEGDVEAADPHGDEE